MNRLLLYVSFAIVILSVVIIVILSNFKESYDKNRPKFKLNVIIPIRNRDKELNFQSIAASKLIIKPKTNSL